MNYEGKHLKFYQFEVKNEDSVCRHYVCLLYAGWQISPGFCICSCRNSLDLIDSIFEWWVVFVINVRAAPQDFITLSNDIASSKKCWARICITDIVKSIEFINYLKDINALSHRFKFLFCSQICLIYVIILKISHSGLYS